MAASSSPRKILPKRCSSGTGFRPSTFRPSNHPRHSPNLDRAPPNRTERIPGEEPSSKADKNTHDEAPTSCRSASLSRHHHRTENGNDVSGRRIQRAILCPLAVAPGVVVLLCSSHGWRRRRLDGVRGPERHDRTISLPLPPLVHGSRPRSFDPPSSESPALCLPSAWALPRLPAI